MLYLAEDLIAPVGEIENAFFPTDDAAALSLRLQAYLDDGYSRTAAIDTAALQDDAARSWAYYRAYDAIYLLMSRAHATKSIAGEASASHLASQIEAFKNKRDGALLAYDTALSEAGLIVDVEATKVAHGGAQPIRPVW
jgi:hypothetical protein